LEASYFRAIPEEEIETKYSIPMSPSIRYSGLLVNHDTIEINDINLIEFGKYFAHVANHHLDFKLIVESNKIIESLAIEEDDIRQVHKNLSNFSTKPRIMTINNADQKVQSYRPSKMHSRINITADINPNELPSVSVNQMRKQENKPKKSSILKQMKKRHPNSRLFKADNFQDQFHQFPQSNSSLIHSLGVYSI
jgi:hypothetical protein